MPGPPSRPPRWHGRQAPTQFRAAYRASRVATGDLFETFAYGISHPPADSRHPDRGFCGLDRRITTRTGSLMPARLGSDSSVRIQLWLWLAAVPCPRSARLWRWPPPPGGIRSGRR
jgi:hypothetical protein